MLFVRELSSDERKRLLALIQRGKSVVTCRRAEIILNSGEGRRVPEIARLLHSSVDHVRDVIHRFNQDGFASLQPAYCGGRPRVFDPKQRLALVELAKTPPEAYGFPWRCWSLRKLQEAAIQRKIATSISTDTIRIVLKEAGVDYQESRKSRPLREESPGSATSAAKRR